MTVGGLILVCVLVLVVGFVISTLFSYRAYKKRLKYLEELEARHKEYWVKETPAYDVSSSGHVTRRNTTVKLAKSSNVPDSSLVVNDFGVSGIFQSVVDHVPPPHYESSPSGDGNFGGGCSDGGGSSSGWSDSGSSGGDCGGSASGD